MASVDNLNYFSERETEENTTDTEEDSGIADESDSVIHLKWPKRDPKQIHGQTPIGLYDYWRGLVTQEAHFSTQLDAAEKEVTYAQSKITELQLRIDELERDIANKTWAIERLQAELVSAQKEDECVRRKLRLQEAEMGVMKDNAADREDELMRKYSDLEVTRNELEIKLKDIQHFTSNLQVQLAEAQSNADNARKERDRLKDERVEEQKLVQDTLDAALTQKDQLEAKFEHLRNVNQEREERLMEDCEWKVRAMQKKCKERLEAITKEHQQAMETNTKLKATAEQYLKELNRLKTIESECNALRGLTSDQRDSLMSVSVQLSEVKAELETAKLRAEQEIRTAQKIKTQCQNDLLDERRNAHMKLEETRMQISMQWENKLLQEMMRLKYELESIYTEERKEALEKLKKDFEKELADLVQKHNNVEQALRKEIADLEETLRERIHELREVSAKCDKQAIDARMYVDRSDRNNQLILDREIQYREEIVAKLEDEREEERKEMERQFSERLQSVSDEFAQELYNNTEELELKHKKALEVQREKLMAEKEEALQNLEAKHKQKISCLETKMKFEEMRMRYERRDPRQEDVRQIAELKEKVEQQERDLHRLTEALREMQITQFGQAAPSTPPRKPGRNAARKNRNSDLKNKMTNCDVIYEEEQETEQSVDAANGVDHD
ncbi:putative leucine-rich repeat-containing protein DDB_G0290503 isoform X2 [Phlebotomus papatasi]|uniref:putative leucine-rich repeat-containing protein DDB_G0290503 isoform X2 n=1 Tax=Phlebotomus papatasi TaxID=29031 RepID=UPI002483E34D|nr:putative leucine-rich repeat-containing protein DDB_G0290503 isoform X2 [Phlebotomus papatasi]XP_055716955.1 putative leucine-rich repeat-containing protein DDB_G0290503 isoform X2 [Phlebotomus papatasi]